MIDARCIRECIWQGRHWREGEEYRGAETPPEHFEVLVIEAEEKTEDKLEDKLEEQKTGRRGRRGAEPVSEV